MLLIILYHRPTPKLVQIFKQHRSAGMKNCWTFQYGCSRQCLNISINFSSSCNSIVPNYPVTGWVLYCRVYEDFRGLQRLIWVPVWVHGLYSDTCLTVPWSLWYSNKSTVHCSGQCTDMKMQSKLSAVTCLDNGPNKTL